MKRIKKITSMALATLVLSGVAANPASAAKLNSNVEFNQLKAANTAIKLAEATKQERHIKAAEDKITSLMTSQEKDDLMNRLEILNQNSKKANEAAILKQAQKALKLAEATKQKKHIEAAKETINQLSEDLKVDLESQLLNINNTFKRPVTLDIERTDFADNQIKEDNAVFVDKAIKAIELAERQRYEVLFRKACSMVDLIKDPELQNELMFRLDAINVK